jgi:molybdopterin converting factor small subunit
MRVRVLLFASFREAAGCQRVDLEVDEGTSAADLFLQMERRFPDMAPLRPYTTFAVNREVVEPGTTLHDADEVAFLQPVSGGEDD